MSPSIALETLQPYLNSTFSILLGLLVLYGFFSSLPLIKHLNYALNYKSIRTDKKLKLYDLIIDHSNLHAKVKARFHEKRNVIYLQRTLGTRETHLEKLEYLTGYLNMSKAVYYFNQCSAMLDYDAVLKKLVLKPEYDIKHANRNRIIGFALYLLISLSAFWVLFLLRPYISAFQGQLVLGIIYILFVYAVVGIIVAIAFKILSYFCRLQNAKILFSLERID